jgi:hypothetical protein
MLDHGVHTSVYCIHIFFHAHQKENSLIYHVHNYHKKPNQITYVPNSQIFMFAIKNQIKSFMFVTVIFLRLP